MLSSLRRRRQRLSVLLITVAALGPLAASSASAVTVASVARMSTSASASEDEAKVRIGTAHNRIVTGLDNQGSVNECYYTDEPYHAWRWAERGSYRASLDGLCGYYSQARNFFSFDLSAVRPGTVSRAVLVLRRFDTLDADSASPDATLTYRLHGVHTGARALTRQSADPAVVFDDLGSGRPYGEVVAHAAADPDDLLRIPLNRKAVTAINDRAGGWFTVGGSVVGQSDENLYALFVDSDGTGIQRLVLTVDDEV